MVGARESAVVAKTVIDMAHNLGLSAVAEGVETSEALQMLADWNCDLVQGYFFSKPVDVLAINSLAASPTWLLDQPLSLDSGAAQRRRSGI